MINYENLTEEFTETEKAYFLAVLDAGIKYMNSDVKPYKHHPVIWELVSMNSKFFHKIALHMIEGVLKSE